MRAGLASSSLNHCVAPTTFVSVDAVLGVRVELRAVG